MIDYDQKRPLIIIGLAAAFLGFASKLVYRPWVLENRVEDYGMAGSAPSFFYVMGACLLIAAFSQKHPTKNMVYAAAGATVYELEQYYTSMVFDFNDMLATGIGLGVAVLLGKGLLSKKKEEIEIPVNPVNVEVEQ